LINLDTNVLLRLLVADDPAQTRKAHALVAMLTPRRPGYVSLVVLAETMGVLGRFYKQSRPQLAGYLELLLDTAELQLEQPGVVRNTLSVFRASTAGFIDCLIQQVGVAANCEYTVTFDQAAAKSAGMRLL